MRKCILKFLISMFVIGMAFSSYVLAFENIDAGLTGVYAGSVIWGDYDNDGDLDLAVAGSTAITSSYISKIYRNDNGSFVDIAASLTPVDMCSLCWGDYDNDGDLDLALAGRSDSDYVSKIYRNDNGNFVDISAGLTGVYKSSLAWGDYDNDGDLDLIISGASVSGPSTKLYRNDAGIFVAIATAISDVDDSSLAWGDYDNDGDLDLALVGNKGSSSISKIYRNDNGIFEDISAGLRAVYIGSVAWGDYDNDGDLDLALTGFPGVSKIYRNDNGSFVDISAALTAVYSSCVVWGDYDNDGDLDLALAGYNTSGRISKIYRNDEGAFVDIEAGLIGVSNVGLSFGDYNNDGKLDLALIGYTASATPVNCIYRSSVTIVNTSPQKITSGLSSVYNTETSKLDLRWDNAIDAQTSNNGLYYEVRIATCSITDSLETWVVAASTGKGIGFASNQTIGNYPHGFISSTTLQCGMTFAGLAEYTSYYWQVRAIDTGGLKGEWSDEQVGYVEVMAPGRITNFSAEASNQIKLTWIATGKNGLVGNITDGKWQVKYSTSSLLAPETAEYTLEASSSWVVGQVFEQEISGLTPDTTYYFWVRVMDSDGRWSLWSDIKSARSVMFGISAELTGVENCYSIWGDYDNDGDLDIALAGYTGSGYISKIYRNDNGSFVDIGASLSGVGNCSLSFGDYDNDGDLDLALAGYTGSSSSVSKIYRNDNGSFVDIGASLSGVGYCSLSFGDYDNDGDLDLALAGFDYNNYQGVSKIYKNDNGNFVDIGLSFASLTDCSLSFGDYDNDGDLDLVLSGYKDGDGSCETIIYRNDNGSFVDISADLVDVKNSSLAWGDYDNDGDLDLAISGITYSSTKISKIYRNDNGSFVDIGIDLADVGYSSLAWGDYDNDGKLDLIVAGKIDFTKRITYIYKSFFSVVNTVPQKISTGFASSYNDTTTKIELRWDKGIDTQTSSDGLYYDVRVATMPITDNLTNWIISPSIGEGVGFSANQTIGNYSHGFVSSTTLQSGLNLKPVLSATTYYWQIRSIDTGAKKGEWSDSQMFYLPAIKPSVPILTSPNNFVSSYVDVLFDWEDSIDDVFGIKNYELEISTDSNFGIINYSSNTFVSSTTISSIQGNELYYWRVRAKNNDDIYGEWSSAWSIVVDTISPSIPVLVPLDIVLSKTVNFDWSDSTDTLSGVASYDIRISTKNDFSSIVVSSNVINSAATFVLTGATYYWQVRSKDVAGNESLWSVLDDMYILSEPSAITWEDCRAVSTNTIVLEWQDNSFNETSYELWLKGITTDTKLATLSANTTYYVSTGLTKANTRYEYYVVSINEVGSATSTVKECYTLADKVINVNLDTLENSVSVAWNDAGANSYLITLSTTPDMSVLFSTDSISDTNYIKSGLRCDTTYYLSIASVNDEHIINYDTYMTSMTTTKPLYILPVTQVNVATVTFVLNGSTRSVVVEIPLGALSEDSYLKLSTTSVTSTMQSAMNKGYIYLAGYMYDFNLYNLYGVERSTFALNIKVTVPYPDDNNDGIIDGSNPEISEDNLQLYYFNPVTNNLEAVGGIVDKDNNVVTFSTYHFSIYGLFGPPLASSTLKDFVVYPNPYKPGTGGKFDRSKIVFSGLTSKADIRIYNIVGELVYEGHEIDGDGQFEWDSCNNSGKKLASGVYLYYIVNPENNSDKVKGKIAIIR